MYIQILLSIWKINVDPSKWFISFVWCMLSVLNNQSRLLVNTRPCKRINKTMQVWMTVRVLLTKLLELFVSSVTFILFSFPLPWSYSTLSDISHFYTAFFFKDHFTNSRCLVQCFISSNKTDLSFFIEFYNDGFSSYCRLGGYKKQQWIIEKRAKRISVYLYSVRQ